MVLYFPAGRSDLVRTRSRREALSRQLLDRDRRILSLVAGMPFVRMVALSGSLAHLNAEGSADLDLFVITAPHRVWSVTVATLVLSKMLGWRKHVCMNYVVSEKRDGDRAGRSLLGEPDHSPAADRRPPCVRSLREVESIREGFSIRTSNFQDRSQAEGPRSQARARATVLVRPAQVAERIGTGVIWLAFAPTRRTVAITRSSETRSGVFEAAYEQSPSPDHAEVRGSPATGHNGNRGPKSEGLVNSSVSSRIPSSEQDVPAAKSSKTGVKSGVQARCPGTALAQGPGRSLIAMEFNKLVFAGLSVGCLAAAAGGSYLAVRQNPVAAAITSEEPGPAPTAPSAPVAPTAPAVTNRRRDFARGREARASGCPGTARKTRTGDWPKRRRVFPCGISSG
jgi:hypothetical protein